MTALCPRDGAPPPTILMIPGRGNSDAGHWQSILERILPDIQRVHQKNWHEPSLDAWSRTIDRAVRRLDHRPLLVAHSFGCLAAAHARLKFGTPVGATLFVAPADPERFGLSRQAFAENLAQPGMLVASSNDPWMSIDKARGLALDWGVRLVELGAAGHINVASGHGPWPLGEAMIIALRRELAASTPAAPGLQSTRAVSPRARLITGQRSPSRHTLRESRHA